MFSLLGVYIFSEVQTQGGRTDNIIKFENEVFIYEFKLNKSTKEAIFQIENKGQADKFKNSVMQVYKVGLSFSSEKKEVEEVLVSEKVESFLTCNSTNSCPFRCPRNTSERGLFA